MVTLGLVHFVYIFLVVLILVIMALNKDIVLPCILGIFIVGILYTHSVVKGFQIIFNSFIASGNEFWSIILIISLIVAMSNSLKELGVDAIMLSPIKKILVNKYVAFFVLGFVMLLISWVIWPSPSVALVGAIMVPAAVLAGLPAIWAAVSMNLFGHGIGLSSDFFIQGAPSITAKAAGLSDTQQITNSLIPLWITMSVVTVATAFIFMVRDTKNKKAAKVENIENVEKEAVIKSKHGLLIAIITPLVFVCDLVLLITFDLKGGDATALVGGTVVLLLLFNSILSNGLNNSLENVTDHIRTGFIFGIKIFAPVIVIGAFFFIGGESTAKAILGEDATGIFNDIGIWLSQTVPISKVTVILAQSAIAFISGLDGSGFAGLPLVGSMAQTFSSAVDIDKAGVASLGQLIAVWVGGGTIIPWAVIPVAAICNVSPVELARKNLIPVLTGLAATIIVAIIIL